MAVIPIHEFETTQGDELAVEDLKNATWKVVETYFDLDDLGTPVFTHRIEVHSIDNLIQPPQPEGE